VFTDLFGDFDQPLLTEKQLAFGRILFRDAGIESDYPCLVFVKLLDGRRPVSYAKWWVFQPIRNGALVDKETSARYRAVNLRGVEFFHFARDVGDFLTIPNCNPYKLPQYVRQGALEALRGLRARQYTPAPHSRYNNIAFRNLFLGFTEVPSALLLAWNPKLQEWDDLENDCKRVANQEAVVSNWRTLNRNDVFIGIRFYLLKQGESSCGIIASGVVLARPEPSDYVDANEAYVYTVSVAVRQIIDQGFYKLLSRDQLRDHRILGTMHWDTQISGTIIPPEVALELVTLWSIHLDQEIGPRNPLADEKRYYEGAKRQFSMDRYERNGQARREAIEFHGKRCHCCDLDFLQMCGKVGRDFIHVHHVNPLSKGDEREVNPKIDLLPVCPNCHAMLHSGVKKPRTVEQLRRIICARNPSARKV
jgi:5-methylcytosine-specific restriction protein A